MTTQDQDDVESLHDEATELGHVVPEELQVAEKTVSVKKAKTKRVSKKLEPQQQEEKTMKTKAKAKKTTAKKGAKKTAKKTAKKVAVKRGTNTTSAKVIAMIRRKGGATRGQILHAIGWKAISVQQVAAGQGVKLKVDTTKRPFHYMAA